MLNTVCNSTNDAEDIQVHDRSIIENNSSGSISQIVSYNMRQSRQNLSGLNLM